MVKRSGFQATGEGNPCFHCGIWNTEGMGRPVITKTSFAASIRIMFALLFKFTICG